MVQSDFVASVYEDGTWCLRALAPRGNEKRKAGDVTYPAKKRKSSKRKSTSEHRKCLDAASHPEVKPGSHKLVVGELVISVSQTTGLEDQTTAKASTSEGRKKRTRSSGGTLAQPQARRAVRSSAKPWIRVECTSICDDDIHSGVQFSHIQQPQPGTTSTFSDSYSICTTGIPNRSIPLASVCSGTRRSSRSTPGRRSSLPGTTWLTKSRTSSLEERQEGFHQVISSERLGDYEQLTQEPEDYLCQECDDQERLEVAKLVSPTEDDPCSEDKRSDPHQHEHELLGLEPLELHQTQLGKRSRRKALLIAITYNSQKWNDPTSKSMQLKGTFGDALDVYSLLLEQGYRPEEIRLMTDEPSQPQTCNDDLPTRRNIERALEELIRDAQPGDQFFLYFAGHGKQVDDISGDEYDGKDEGIIPCDWTTGYNYADEGIIIDDYMRATCINPLPEGCQLIALFDCCHSGTILDLPKEYPPPNRRVMFNPKHVHEKVRARVICFAACKDPEEAQERQGRGLATQAFTKCIRSSCNTAARRWYEEPVAYNPTIGDLFNYMRSSLCTQNGKQIQYPLLTSSFEMIGKELDKRIKI